MKCQICKKEINGEPVRPSKLISSSIRRIDGVVCSIECAHKFLVDTKE